MHHHANAKQKVVHYTNYKNLLLNHFHLLQSTFGFLVPSMQISNLNNHACFLVHVHAQIKKKSVRGGNNLTSAKS